MARDPSKTEKATPKRRKKTRDKGQVAKGQEVQKVTTLLAGVLAVRYLIGYLYDQIAKIYTWAFTDAFDISITTSTAYMLFTMQTKNLAKIILPIMLILAFIAFLTMRLQVGSLWSFSSMKPKFKQLFNIISGLKKLMLSPDAFIRLGKSVLQAAAVGLAPYIVLRQEFDNLLPLFYSTPHGIAAYILSMGYKMTIYALIPMTLIAIVDLWYQFWKYEQDLKMTKDEVKDERKQAEGDPQIKSKQREKVMEFMVKRMMQDVPKADVVITNPTHIAVALKYNALEAPAPLVLAKGAGPIAEKIKEIARENKIPIQENKPLAQALYKQVEIGEMIPEELYQAVAAILAKLDKFKR
ncbi:flagellar biosynthesis protein FlhB [Salidesulfovibrio onnuriiensis]|uniref:flagellar biosynthesis protein FlhB n=1 Tax=Salidesulfovibrio onnuriiensis TaxID=2583823 RepID=UPI0011CB46BA|nr:flagellar biosynthesis protein FlhB [Salidesulfovibrio onnuriiensis]